MKLTRITRLAGVACLGFAVTAGAPVAAADRREPPPFKEFTFKKIGVPGKGESGRRITIQIEPQPDPPPEEVAAVEHDTPTDESAGEREKTGFWSVISPALAEAGPGRLEAALLALDAEAEIYAPRLEDIRRITDAHGADILRYTVGTRVSPALVAAIISVESSGRVTAVSSAGAQGLMQLMPATAERFGVTDWSVPSQNIRGGVAYLDWLMKEFDHDPLMTLAGYNAGEGAVRKHSGVPPYAETRAYVPKVLAAWRVASGLCLTRPELLSDGCVFIGG